MSGGRRDRVNDLFEAFSLGDGCATCLAYVVILVAFIVCVSALWTLLP